MNGNLLDTNVVVRILNGDKSLIKTLSEMRNLCTCTVVLGELLFGAAKSIHKEENKRKARDFCSHYPFIHLTESVSYAYGDLKKDLQSHGLTLPENDMWIAATALANNLAVITQDKHFDSIPNLTVIKL